MTYRNITVQGKEYQYVIGKTNTKIKDVGVFENNLIGNPVLKEFDSSIQPKYEVTPSIVAGLIGAHLTQEKFYEQAARKQVS